MARFFLLGMLGAVAFAAPAQAAITFTLNTGSTSGNAQKLLIDSNNCSAEGPHAAFVGGTIRNTGTSAVDNVIATMSTPTGDIYFTGGQAASQSIGTLGAGESIGVYWYVGYNCVEAATATPTITVTSTIPTVTSTVNLKIWKAISAQAGGDVSSTLLGPGAVVGQTIDYQVTYSFGGASAGDEYLLQPAGNQSFNASCFRLVSSQITASAVNAIPNGAVNQFYFVASGNQGGSKQAVSMTYRFQYLCADQSTVSDAYATQTSGSTNLKYTGNYGTSTISYPPGTNPFKITKTVSVSSRTFGSPATPLTYTVTITNPSNFATYIDRIDDVLPSGVSFASISSGSQITAALSSSTPASGATGAISFRGKVGTSYALAANSSISLIYTVNAPTAIGTYINTAQGAIGQASTPTASATFTINGVIAANNDPAGSVPGSTGAANVINVLTNDTLDGAAAATATVTINQTSAASNAGVTLNTSNGFVSVAAGTPAGAYSIGYEICQIAVPTNCANATVSITVSASVDLAITKTNGVNAVTSGSTVTYTVTVTNTGPDAAVGAVVTDTVGTGLTCPPANPVSITGNGIPSGSFTTADLTGAGITLGTLTTGQTATLSYSCQVN